MTREEAIAMVQDLAEACAQREHSGSRAQYIKDDVDFAAKVEAVVTALTNGAANDRERSS